MSIKLNKYQKDAIRSIHGNIAVIACPGSGKTSMLTYRIVNMVKNGIKPENILAITFSRAAAENMQKRIKGALNTGILPTINTFHSIGLGILREKCEGFDKFEIATDYWVDGSLIDICVKKLGVFGNSDEVPVGFIRNYINIQKLNLNGHEDKMEYVKDIPSNLSEDVLVQIYRNYELLKVKEGKIDFSDMLFKAYKLLLSDEDVRDYYQKKWTHILVDESQDCNMLQFEIVKIINEKNVFMCGDIQQSIYGFMQSSPRFMLDFKDTFKDAKYINLPINYRCSKEIVDLANRLISNSEEVNHECYKDAIPNKDSFKEPELKFYTTPKHEIEEITKKIKNMVESKQYEFKDIAILLRANAQSSVIQATFCEHEIPFEIIGGDNFFERKEIRDILNFLKVVNNEDKEAFRKIYNTPSRWLGKVFLDGLEEYANKYGKTMVSSLGKYSMICKKGYKNGIFNLINILDSARRLKGKGSVGDVARCIVEKSKYKEYIINEYNDDSRIENLDNFINQADKYKDIGEFLDGIQKILEKNEEIKRIKKKKKNGEIDAVKVLTAHKSKGLEYPVVFCVSLNQGMFPHHKGDVSEERRLCYVAITRAEKELYLSTTRSSNGYPCDPSEFLYEMFDDDYVYECSVKK